MRLALALLAFGLGVASADTFDIATYTVPPGWTSAPGNGGVTISKVDEAKSQFGLIALAPSRASAGSVQSDFKSSWDKIAPTLGITAAPRTTSRRQDGWDVLAGGAPGRASGIAANVMVVTLTGHGRTFTVVVTTNLPDLAPVDAFLASLRLEAASAARTTTFPDGWTARALPDWVELTRGTTRVRLHYRIAFDDESRRDPIPTFWQKLVAPRYPLAKVMVRPYSATSFPFHFGQADTNDGLVSLRLLVENGVVLPIEVFTPSRAAFDKDFPDQDKLAAIAAANRFAVGPDVAATWIGGESASVNLYSTATGAYAGMSTAVVSDKFVFDGGGGYRAEHSGASGGAGSQRGFRSEEVGSYTVSSWELTTKEKTKTTVYDAFYEAVRGGVLLHLRDKLHAGMQYTLARQP